MKQKLTDLTLTAFVLGIGGWAWVDANSTRREISDDAWGRVRAHLDANVKPPDAIVIRPAWHSEAAPRLLPHRTDLYGPIDDDFFAHAGRIFAITTDPATLPPRLLERRAETEERIGPVTVRRYRAARPLVTYAFRDSIHEARVALHPKDSAGGEPTLCSFYAFESWWCVPRPSLEDWRSVGPRRVAVGGVERRWIWAHPHDGRVLQITFPRVRLGTKLVVNTGLLDRSIAPGLAPIDVRIVIDGIVAKAITHANAPGVAITQVATTPGTYQVVFEVESASNKQRHFAFDAVAVDEAAP